MSENVKTAAAPSDPYTALALAGLELASQVIALFPNYEQKKVEEFHDLKKELEIENKKPAGIRNDQLVLDLGDELRRHVEDFSAILREQGVEGLRPAGR